MRGVRLNPLGGALLAVAAASLAAMLLVERLAVPAGVVLALAVLILVADGLATDVPPGLKRIDVRPEDRPGPRRQRFDPTAPARVSAEVDDEAWRRERLRRRERS